MRSGAGLCRVVCALAHPLRRSWGPRTCASPRRCRTWLECTAHRRPHPNHTRARARARLDCPRARAHSHTLTHARAHAHTHARARTRTLTHARAHTHTHSHTHAHARTLTHLHERKRTEVHSPPPLPPICTCMPTPLYAMCGPSSRWLLLCRRRGRRAPDACAAHSPANVTA